MTDAEVRALIAEAREWIRSMGNVFHNESASKVIARLADALETTIVRAERLEAQERYDVTKYRDWKRNHNPLTVSKVRKWAVEAQKEVYAGNGWITHEDYRRAVVPGNLIPVLEQVEGVVVERDAAVAAVERVAVEIEAVAGGITSSSEAAGYRNGLLRAAQVVRASLDGAPEPKWEAVAEYGVKYAPTNNRASYTVRFGYESREDAEHSLGRLGRNQKRNPDRLMYREVRTGPWLPVEGESK